MELGTMIYWVSNGYIRLHIKTIRLMRMDRVNFLLCFVEGIIRDLIHIDVSSSFRNCLPDDCHLVLR